MSPRIKRNGRWYMLGVLGNSEGEWALLWSSAVMA